METLVFFNLNLNVFIDSKFFPIFVTNYVLMSNVSVRGPFYRLEQISGGGANPNFAFNSLFNDDILANSIKRVSPVNVSGGARLGNFGYLYSKITFERDGLLQEVYTLQTVLQWQTTLNS